MQRTCLVNLAWIIAVAAAWPAAETFAQPKAESAAKGREFLVSLFDPSLNLVPEFHGSSVYWLYHDNYLVAKLLAGSHPEIARKIRAAIAGYGINKSGKIEIIFGEAQRPLPFRHFLLTEVQRVGDKVIKTEIVTEKEMADWGGYADLLCLAALAEEEPAKAKQRFRQAMALWDGKGFCDRASHNGHRYSTYKLALALLAAAKVGERPAAHDAMLQRLRAQQARDGGWITDYNANLKPVGKANAETTAMAILAMEAAAR